MKFFIPENIKNQIRDYAESRPDEEVCGYWLPQRDRFVAVDNVSPDRSSGFRIDPECHVELSDEYPDLIIVHSHIGDDMGAILSDADIISSKICNVPYLLYHTQYQQWDYFDPKNLHSYPLIDNPYSPEMVEFYLGHRWQWERFDCYTLFRNFYKGFLGIDLQDFSRKGNENIVLDSQWNQYENNFESQGFKSVADRFQVLDFAEKNRFENYDVLLMNLVGTQTHHAAILIDKQNMIAIQIQGEDRLSHRFRVTDAHLRRTRKVIRHKSFI